MTTKRQEFKKITVRIPRDLHKSAKITLAESEKSFQEFFVNCLGELTIKK
jgi:hypothetical protein